MKKHVFSKVEIISLVVIIIMALACFAAYFFHLYIVEPEIKLKGENEITIELKEEYNDPGIIAKLEDKDISNNVKIDGKVDNTKIGDYTLTYSVTNSKGKKKREVTRIVKVRDKVKPVLKLKGYTRYNVNYASQYKELGYTATDNYDGTITDKVKVEGTVDTNKLGTYKITYTVEDSSSNKTTVNRIVKVVDKKAPSIKLKGKSRMVIKVGASYKESGYTAYDNYDKDLTNSVSVKGKINTSKAGIYEVIYSVKDSSGNYNSVSRFVQVGDQSDIDEDNYIMVSIKEQKLWYYKNGKLYLSTNVVTGKKGVWDTLTGRFRITDKVAGTYLVGADYKCWVDYWMLFDYRSQSGFHDATWLSSFGGDVYETRGSHGCVNMPYSKARSLFNSVSLGTLVLIY